MAKRKLFRKLFRRRRTGKKRGRPAENRPGKRKQHAAPKGRGVRSKS